MIVHLLTALASLALSETKTFTSRSGERQLQVEGNHDGSFELVQHGPGEKTWTTTVHHSVGDAFVCENGVVVAHGVASSEAAPTGEAFALTILAAGEVRLLELRPVGSHISHVGPRPEVKGLFVWEELDTCAFRIDDLHKPDELWTYALSDGAPKSVIAPEQVLAGVLRGNWHHFSMQRAVAPGANDLLLATFWRFGPIKGRSGPGNYVGPDLHGVAALFRADGELLWHQELADGYFLGEIKPAVSTRDTFGCEIEVTSFKDVGRRREHTVVDKFPLLFHRDAAGVWHKE